MFDVLFFIVPIFAILTIVFVIAQMISPKFRGKIMSRQIKAAKYMMDESKNDIEVISSSMANATKGGVETTSRAVKKGFTSDDVVFCKYCDYPIDRDSKYCKNCGKKQ